MSMGFPFHRVLRLIEALSIAPNKFEALRHGRWAAGPGRQGLGTTGDEHHLNGVQQVSELCYHLVMTFTGIAMERSFHF
jgi:hypothetical protein